jgi:hypothetical protein
MLPCHDVARTITSDQFHVWLLGSLQNKGCAYQDKRLRGGLWAETILLLHRQLSMEVERY